MLVLTSRRDIASQVPLRHRGGRPCLDRLWLIGAVGAARVVAGKVGQNGLARDRGLAFRDQSLGAERQIDVEPGAEADQAETLAGADRLAFPNEADDALGD